MRRVVLDIEHTGYGFAQGGRMVEIGGVEIVGSEATGNVFHAYVNPLAPMNYHAQRIHRLSLRFLRTMPVFPEVADELLSFIGGSAVLLHNARGDLLHLNGELALVGRQAVPRSQVFDAMKLARRARLPKPGLDGMIRDLGILVPERSVHSALSDAIVLAEAVRLLEDPAAKPRELKLPSRSSLRRSASKQSTHTNKISLSGSAD